MTEIAIVLLSSLLLIWSFSNLDINQSSPIFIFSAFFSSMISSIVLVRLAVRALEFLHFESDRDKALICSKRARHNREMTRPPTACRYAALIVPTGRMRPATFGAMPKTVLF